MKKNNNGFTLFAGLIVITLVAIVAVVVFVSLKKPVVITGLPSAYASPIPNVMMHADSPTVPPDTTTPVPTISSSTDIQIIGKEIDDTKVNSVDDDFNAMSSSASSL